MTFKITHIHADVGSFGGGLYFLLDNKLLFIDVCTPNFNDFDEWRLREIKLSNEDYVPKQSSYLQESDLTPYDIPDFELTGAEYEFFKSYFVLHDDVSMYKNELTKFKSKYPDAVSPYEYVDVNTISGYRNEQGELEYPIYKTGQLIDDCYYDNVIDYTTTLSTFEPKESITEYQGIYKWLIPLLEMVDKGYYHGK